jgi:hypothetical protein
MSGGRGADMTGEHQTDVYKEKRKHFRVNTDIPCEMGLPRNALSAARIIDLSLSGLKFRCDRTTIHAILPEDQRTPGRVWDVEIEIHFTLQNEACPAVAVDARARVIHSERLAQDAFHVGVEFTELDAAARKSLEDYILGSRSRQSQPAGHSTG